MLSYAAAGQLAVAFESVPLDGIAQAWDRQARGEAPVRIVRDLLTAAPRPIRIRRLIHPIRHGFGAAAV